MQIYFKENLAMLAIPKTGSTAYEMALRGRADIIFAKRRKHMGLQKFHVHVAPFLATAYDLKPDLLAVMRDPLEQLRSWYRYRCRPTLDGTRRSTKHVSFDEFVRAVVEGEKPPWSQVGCQINLLTLKDGSMPLHHLFAYEVQPKLLRFLETRFDTEIAPKQKNVSPQIPAEIEPDTLRALHIARAQEFDLYARLRDADGHLQQEIT